MYENNPQTIGELKAAITGKIRQIPKEECVRVIDNVAFNAEENIWSTLNFRKEHKNYAN